MAPATATLPPDRALSLRATAKLLGCSPSTVRRLECVALAKIAAGLRRGPSSNAGQREMERGQPYPGSATTSDVGHGSAYAVALAETGHDAELRYLARLMACPWGEYPDAEPPS